MKLTDFYHQIFKGRTIYRILFNWQVAREARGLVGNVLDLGGDKNQSYFDYLGNANDVIVADLDSRRADLEIDFNKVFPLPDNSFQNIFLFNAIYIADDPVHVLHQCKRVLKEGGKLFIASPFISNEMREPHDYRRFTSEGLETIFKKAGFQHFEIKSFGERFSSATYLLHKFWMFNFVRFIVYGLALLLDKFIPKKLRDNYPTPLGYFCVLTK